MLTLTSAMLDALAARLAEAEAQRAPLAPLTDEHPTLGVSDAYAIQARGIATKCHAGARVLGHKAGYTSAAMQRQMGVTEPNYGVLLDTMLLSDGDVIVDRLIHPRVEPEIAFVLGADLAGPDVTPEMVLAATTAVAPALEIVDSRFRDYRFRAPDNTADNSSAAALVLGAARVAPDALDLAAVPVSLALNGVEIERGSGAAALGHPARAVAWIANALAVAGDRLRAGEIVIAGGLTAAPRLSAGDTVVATLPGIGTVSARCR